MRWHKVLAVMCTFTLLSWPTLAHDDSWIEVRSPHFTVSSNAGEREARRIAKECEEIRAVFQVDHPELRTDTGRPLIIIAVKDDNSLKVLLPDYWAVKGQVRPPGMFYSDAQENFLVLRTDVQSRQGENPYFLFYQEYGYFLLRLNYSTLPVWLRVGIATYYANTIVGDNQTEVGVPTRAQVALLQKAPLIPLEQLMNADWRSPLVNKEDTYNLFFADSWAIVHYFSLDPSIAKQQLLDKYLKAWDETGDGAESARRAFGNLKDLQDKIDNYARQPAFYSAKRPSSGRVPDRDYVVRSMSHAEALVVQANFLQHTNHFAESRPMLQEALRLEPDLAAVHRRLGFDEFVQHNNDGAETEFLQAIKLDPNDYLSHFYLAEIVDRKSGYGPQSTPQMIAYLEKAVEINPNFAPAWAFLSVAYRQQPATKQKALDAGIKAQHLEPAMLAYMADVGDALIALDRGADARAIGEKISKSASTPQEKTMAEMYARRLAHYEETAGQEKDQAAADKTPASIAAPAAQRPAGAPQPQ